MTQPIENSSKTKKVNTLQSKTNRQNESVTHALCCTYFADTKHTKEKSKKLSDKRKRDQSSLKELQAASAEAADSIPGLERSVEQLSKQKEAAEQTLETETAAVRAKTGDITSELQRKQKELMPKKQVVNQAQAALTDIDNQLQRQTDSEKSARAALATAQQQLSTQQTELKQKQTELKSAEKEVTACSAGSEQCKQQCSGVEAAEQKLMAERQVLFTKRGM
jgi:chromosome segregation ATPase